MFRPLLALFIVCFTVLQSPALLAAEANDYTVWIDVRPAREFRQGHIEGAINIYHGDIGHKVFQFVDDVFKEVHIYDGNSGTFAGLALELLTEMGFQEVVNEGSYENVLAKQAAAEQ